MIIFPSEFALNLQGVKVSCLETLPGNIAHMQLHRKELRLDWLMLLLLLLFTEQKLIAVSCSIFP